MIFVIIGVVILVISFVIALQSLVKEQNKSQATEEGEEFTKSNETSNILKKSIREDKTNAGSRPIKAVSQAGVINQSKTPTKRDPFPWEEEFGSGPSKRTDSDQDKIEGLRSQLAKLKAAKGSLDTVDTGENGKEEIHEEGKSLSGEISLRDLKKKSA